jgi:hypothetical protein
MPNGETGPEALERAAGRPRCTLGDKVWVKGGV